MSGVGVVEEEHALAARTLLNQTWVADVFSAGPLLSKQTPFPPSQLAEACILPLSCTDQLLLHTDSLHNVA